jgi:hypothetical protein
MCNRPALPVDRRLSLQTDLTQLFATFAGHSLLESKFARLRRYFFIVGLLNRAASRPSRITERIST